MEAEEPVSERVDGARRGYLELVGYFAEQGWLLMVSLSGVD